MFIWTLVLPSALLHAAFNFAFEDFLVSFSSRILVMIRVRNNPGDADPSSLMALEIWNSTSQVSWSIPPSFSFHPKKTPPPKDIADKWHDDRLLGRSSGRFSLWKFTQAFSEQFLTLVVVSMRTHNKKKSNFLAVTCRIKIIHLT